MTMITGIQGDHMIGLREVSSGGLPIARRTQHTVKQQERWLARATKISMI
jgi:hypothetical protein